MELTELQSVWSLINAEIESRELVDEQMVSTTIRKRSNTELSNIKRSLHLKFVMGSVVTLISAGATIASVWFPEKFQPLDFLFNSTETILFYATLTVSLSTMLRFNYRAYREIQSVQTSAVDLKTALERFISVMTTAIRFNIYSDTFMSPIFFTWFYYAYAFQDQMPAWDLRTLMLVILPLAVGIFSFFVQRYLQYLKFGRYLNRLKSYLETLEAK